VQSGFEPGDWKSMATVGTGVFEIRIHACGEYRVLYVTRFPEAVYVIHAFQKRSKRTPKLHMELARKNLALVSRTRR
jgi:phage-related protein